MTENTYADRLYSQYRPLWFKLAFQIVRDPNDAEDVVQESFRKFLAAGREWPSFEDARRYFSTILTHTAIDYYRLSRRSQSLEDLSNSRSSPEPEAPNWRRPWEEFERRREEGLLRESLAAISRLPEAQRQAVELLILDEEGASLTEYSRRLGVPITTLRSRALLGVKKVKRMLRKKRLL